CRARLRCIISYLELICRSGHLGGSEAHERVAICRSDIDVGAKQFLDRKANPLRGHFRAAAEDTRDPRFGQGLAVFFKPAAKGVQQLWRREHTLNFMIGREYGQGLVDYMLLISLEMLHPAFLDEFDHPARIEINT